MMTNRIKAVSYFLIFISLIILIFSSTLIDLSFFSFASFITTKKETKEDTDSPQNPSQIQPSRQEFTYKLQIDIFHNLPLLGKYIHTIRSNFITLNIIDSNKNTIVKSEKMRGNSSFLTVLPLGVYDIYIIFELYFPTSFSIINSRKVIINYNITYQLTKLFLNEDKYLRFYLNKLTIEPSIIEFFDNNGNNIIELGYGELITATIPFNNKITKILEDKFEAEWAFIFINDIAISLTKVIPKFPTYLFFIFSLFINEEILVDTKEILSGIIDILFIKYEELEI